MNSVNGTKKKKKPVARPAPSATPTPSTAPAPSTAPTPSTAPAPSTAPTPSTAPATVSALPSTPTQNIGQEARLRLSAIETAKKTPQWMVDRYEPGVVIRGKDTFRKFLHGPMAGQEYLESTGAGASEVRYGPTGTQPPPAQTKDYVDVMRNNQPARQYTRGPMAGIEIPKTQLRNKLMEQYRPTPTGGWEQAPQERTAGNKLVAGQYKTTEFGSEREVPGVYDPITNKWSFAEQPVSVGKTTVGQTTAGQGSTKNTTTESGVAKEIDIRSLLNMKPKERRTYLDQLEKTNPRGFLSLAQQYSERDW